MIGCCFHTDERYERMAYRLVESGKAFGLEVRSYGFPKQESWRANVALKHWAILKTMGDCPKDDVLYIDADAELVANPIVDWDTESTQLAAYFDAGPTGKIVPCGGTLWFKNSPLMRAFVKHWGNLCVSDLDSDDAWVHLASLCQELSPEMMHHLPPAWSWYEKTMRERFPGTKPIINHFCVGAHDFFRYS
jgi:hypothetical protein